MKIFLSVLLSLLISSVAMSQVCPNSVTLRLGDSECPIGATCTGKGAPLTLLEHDRNLANVAAICLWADGVTGGSGTSVILDLADDGTNESTAIAEIAVTNDTRSAFTEPSANKLLIDVNKIRMPSLLNPRVTPHANDCEFDSGVCAGWSWSSAPSSGTVNPVVAPGTDVYDASAWPGWLLVQSASNHALRYSAGTTLNSDFTAWGHFMMSDTTVATTSVERRVGLGAWNSADTNESIACSITTNSSGAYRVQLLIQNNGSYSTQESHTIEDGEFMDPIIALYRTGNDFWCMVYSPTGGSFTLGAKLTKTGTVTFDTFEAYLYGDNITPLPVLGVDFVRFAESLKLPEMN